MEEERPISLFDDLDSTAEQVVATTAGTLRIPKSFLKTEQDWLAQRDKMASKSLLLGSMGKSISNLNLNTQKGLSFPHKAGPDWLARRGETTLESPPSSPKTRVLDANPAHTGLRIVPSPSVMIAELEGSSVIVPNPNKAPDVSLQSSECSAPQRNEIEEIDEDDQALARAIQESLKNGNRYTMMGTDLADLQQALIKSQWDK
jgi:hypothetical protein